MTFSWPIEIVQDLRRLISLDTFSQLGQASVMMLTSKETIFPLLGRLILVGFSIYSRRHFTFGAFQRPRRESHQDHFWLTLRTVFWSILVASPLPVLWMTLGYGLREAWPYPLAVAIGDGVTATVPLLWVVMICATFARPMACLSPTLAGRVIACARHALLPDEHRADCAADYGADHVR
jgi:potassium efflux system protein